MPIVSELESSEQSTHIVYSDRSNMSRNRPRPRDNGFGNNEELELWTKICQDIRKSKEKFDQQTSLSVQIKALIDKITNEGNRERPRTSFPGPISYPKTPSFYIHTNRVI